MGQALQKFELVEANASRSAIVTEDHIADRIGDPLRTAEKWLFAVDLSDLAGIAERVARRAIKARA